LVSGCWFSLMCSLPVKFDGLCSFWFLKERCRGNSSHLFPAVPLFFFFFPQKPFFYLVLPFRAYFVTLFCSGCWSCRPNTRSFAFPDALAALPFPVSSFLFFLQPHRLRKRIFFSAVPVSRQAVPPPVLVCLLFLFFNPGPPPHFPFVYMHVLQSFF